MAGSKQAAALIAAVLLVTSVSVPAEANRRCGYDRYGYNAPDFSGCYRYYREGWGFGPAYVPYRALRRACAGRGLLRALLLLRQRLRPASAPHLPSRLVTVGVHFTS